MIISDLLQRAADEPEELDRLVASEFGDGSPDEDITRDATALRTLAERFEKPTEAMVLRAVSNGWCMTEVAENASTPQATLVRTILASTIAAAGEGL